MPAFVPLRRWSARDDLHVQVSLILSQVGLLFPVNHAPMKMETLTAPLILNHHQLTQARVMNERGPLIFCRD